VKSGFDYDRPGVRHLTPETVTLNQRQVDALVASATGISAPQAEIEPSTVGSEQIITAAEEMADSDEELAAAPEAEANTEPEPDAEYAPQPAPEPEPSSDLLERATAYAHKLSGGFWEGIEKYRLPAGDEGLRTRRTELLFGELLAVIAHAGEFFADAHKIKKTALAEEHEAVRIQCRAAMDAVGPLMKELGSIDGRLRSQQQKCQESRVLFNSLSEGKPKPEQYPSAREIALWEASVQEARVTLDKALALANEANGERNEIVRAIREQRELLNGRGDQPGLKHREVALRAQLEGKPYRDHHTGFDVPPEF